MLGHLPRHDPRLLIGPEIGEDAAVIDTGDRYLVVSTDPITFATDHIGRYAVHVNANDVAVLGARPLWFFVVLLLPEGGTTPELVETIMADVQMTCEEVGVTLGGGHTEITQGLDRPILVGQMLGEVAPTHLGVEESRCNWRSHLAHARCRHRGHCDPRAREVGPPARTSRRRSVGARRTIPGRPGD